MTLLGKRRDLIPASGSCSSQLDGKQTQSSTEDEEWVSCTYGALDTKHVHYKLWLEVKEKPSEAQQKHSTHHFLQGRCGALRSSQQPHLVQLDGQFLHLCLQPISIGQLQRVAGRAGTAVPARDGRRHLPLGAKEPGGMEPTGVKALHHLSLSPSAVSWSLQGSSRSRSVLQPGTWACQKRAALPS